jgi:lipopolysaccharide export LptBFGC system permease protein LptF
MQPSLVPFHQQLNTPPTTKGFELSQIRTPQEAKKLLVGEAWYYWSETENRFERWTFFSTHFARTAKDLDHNSVWKFMDESNLLALGEGEETQLFSLYRHKDIPDIFVTSLDETVIFQLFQLPHPSLEFYTKIGGKEGYLDAYEKLVEPIKKEEAALWKKVITIFLIFAVGACVVPFIDKKNSAGAFVLMLLLGGGMFALNWNDLIQKKAELRKKAGLIPAYQNPKISL